MIITEKTKLMATTHVNEVENIAFINFPIFFPV